MKKILFVFVLGSFLGLGLNANACDGHKSKTTKASTETVTKTPVTTASTSVAKDTKKECTPAEKAACSDKAAKSCCSTKKTTTKKS